MSCQIEPDAWLTRVLDRPTFRVAAVDEIDPQALGRRLATALGRGPGFAYAKVPMGDVRAIEALSRNDFHPVDTAVTFQRGSEPPVEWRAPHRIEVRRATAEELIAARDLAGRCMVLSRFHVDPRLGAAIGDAVSRAWIQSYCDGVRGEEVLVAFLDGAVSGFNAVLRTSAAGTPCRVVDLIGVDERHRGQGVAQSLMQRFVLDTLGMGVGCMRVTTQASNVAAVNLYERNGFRLAESALVMHRHLA